MITEIEEALKEVREAMLGLPPDSLSLGKLHKVKRRLQDWLLRYTDDGK
jgi:hypothetical protein